MLQMLKHVHQSWSNFVPYITVCYTAFSTKTPPTDMDTIKQVYVQIGRLIFVQDEKALTTWFGGINSHTTAYSTAKSGKSGTGKIGDFHRYTDLKRYWKGYNFKY